MRRLCRSLPLRQLLASCCGAGIRTTSSPELSSAGGWACLPPASSRSECGLHALPFAALVALPAYARAAHSRAAQRSSQDFVSLNNIADNPGATHSVRAPCLLCLVFEGHLAPDETCMYGSLQAVMVLQIKRVGRGIGSGLGKTSGRGHKGQKARSGAYAGLGATAGFFVRQSRPACLGLGELPAADCRGWSRQCHWVLATCGQQPAAGAGNLQARPAPSLQGTADPACAYISRAAACSERGQKHPGAEWVAEA